MLAASNKINKYIKKPGYTHMINCWTLDKPMASLLTCHLGVLTWMAILLNLVIFMAQPYLSKELILHD